MKTKKKLYSFYWEIKYNKSYIHSWALPTIIVTLIGIMATIFAVSSSIPQIVKSIKTRKTDDVSIWLVIVLIIGLSLWVVYGIGINDLVIIIANSIAVCINTILLLLKIKYSKDPISWSSFTDFLLYPKTGFILNFILIHIFRIHYFYYDVM